MHPTGKVCVPMSLRDMVRTFFRSVPVLSLMCKEVTNHVYHNFNNPLLNSLRQDCLSPQNLEKYARAIFNKGAAIANCWGFVDGTVRAICRPKEPKRVMYNGHKRVHLGHKDFFDIAKLSSLWFKTNMKDDTGSPVQWMKIRQFRYEKSSTNSVEFRYDFKEEFREMRLSGSRRRVKEMQLQKLYHEEEG